MSALLLTLLSFAIILMLGRFKLPLWLAILGGALALGLFFRLDVLDLLRVSLTAATRGMSIGLLLTLALLLVLSEAMCQTGRLDRMVLLVHAFFRRPAITLAVLPALIGLLPMPGGAMFSAPMVRQAAGDDGRIKGDLLSAVNYWWRHIWEHWWPLYPGVILAMSLTQSDLLTFAMFQIPLGLFMVLGGVPILRRLHPDFHQTAPPPPPGTTREILRAMAPIGLILLVWFIGDLGFKTVVGHRAGGLSETLKLVGQFAPLILGLVVSLVFTLASKPLPAGQMRRLIRGKTLMPLLGLALSVMIYQQMLMEVKAAELISRELVELHVPVLSVVIVLPFIAGMLTGVAFGFVGVSFPLVLSLVAAMPGTPAVRPYAVLAYACGHLGMMISPIHLCYVVSNRYFSTTYGATMRLMIGPCLLVAGLAAVYFLFLRWLL
jgi:hypothetical protein